jgi:hypothetical protein
LHDSRDIFCFSVETFFAHFTDLKADLKLAFKLSIRCSTSQAFVASLAFKLSLPVSGISLLCSKKKWAVPGGSVWGCPVRHEEKR